MLLLSLRFSLTTTEHISLTQLLSLYLVSSKSKCAGETHRSGEEERPCQHLVMPRVRTSVYQEGAESVSRNLSGHSPMMLQQAEEADSILSNEEWIKALRIHVACGEEKI